MRDATHTTDGQSPIEKLEQRVTALEQENETLKAALEHQNHTPDVTRRQTLAGLLGGGALLGAAGTASAQSGEDRANNGLFAAADHDHSGDYLGESQPVDHIDTNQLHTSDLANVKVVGPGGYDSIQAAHDALPDGGGQILLTGDVTETDIVLSKWTKLVGGGGGLGNGGVAPRTPIIDTSGGNGIHLESPDCTLRDVLIVGDKTGGYGLKLGVEGKFRGRYTVENVSVHDKGGHGILIVGAHLNDRLDINARNCAGNGWHWNHDWFNENLIFRLGANKCDGDGIHIDGRAFNGNNINMLWSEDNGGWGMYIADDTIFQGNNLRGYGIEQLPDQAGEPLRTLYMPATRGDGNMLHFNILNAGEIQLDESAFASLVVGYTSGSLWRNDSPVRLGDESDSFTIEHSPKDSTLRIRSDTGGLIGTIDKQGNASFAGNVNGNTTLKK